MSLFEDLIAWLRRKGVNATNPLHALRKEFGSQINAQHRLYAAKEALRHADIQTTAAHCLDRKQRTTSGLGRLLLPSKVVDLTAGEASGAKA
ncbi:MAG TPA: hypothetical protein VGD78_15350 [Chthoniobacterales bacterium]